MSSVQTELSSARLCNSLTIERRSSPPDPPSHPAFEEISARIGGRFSADLATILRDSVEHSSKAHLISVRDTTATEINPTLKIVSTALCAGNVQEARDFLQHHAPEQMAWLEAQISRSGSYKRNGDDRPKSPVAGSFLSNITVVPNQVKIDAEAGRIARALGQFGVFRAWAYAQAVDDGDGWVGRHELETLWKHADIAHSPRHARRLIRQGVEQGYWTQDKERNRIYLTGQVRVATQLVRTAMEAGNDGVIDTNLPGRRCMMVCLAGSSQAASARLYAAWLVSKDPQHKGTIISRETLCRLWRVSVPTLLTWESISGIDSKSNYAQQNNTAIDHVPSHAYLTLNREGSYAVAWRLPNTYFVGDQTIKLHARTGKAKKIRRAAHHEIAMSEQRGSIGDAALLRSDKRYFTEGAHSSFRACGRYLLKLGRHDGDLAQRRYFYIGQRYGVRIYEPYNIHTDLPETCLHQRLIWQECCDNFTTVKQSYRRIVEGCS